MTSRRGFLGLLGAVAAAAAFDPERALWVPGAKTISIPAPELVPVEMFDYDALFRALSNRYANRYALVTLDDHEMVRKAINGDYGEIYGRLPKLGDTLRMRLAPRFEPLGQLPLRQ